MIKNFIKSKSIIDVVYLVMMILIVTLIKDMVMSIVRKRKNKKWLKNTFKHNESSDKDDVVEGFSINPCPAPPDNDAPVCDKLQFLLCNDNFGKLKMLLSDDNMRRFLRINMSLTEDDIGFLGTFSKYINTNIYWNMQPQDSLLTGVTEMNTVTKYEKLKNIIESIFYLKHDSFTNTYKNMIMVERGEFNESSAPHLSSATVWGNLNVTGSITNN